MFYVKFQNKTSSSTLLHYRSDSDVASTVTEFIISVSAGDITITLTNFGSWLTNDDIVNNQWYHIIYERDISNIVAKFYGNHIDMGHKAFASNLTNAGTTSPGVIRIGGKLDGTSSFNGYITCLQVAPCLDANTASTYDPECQPANWPATTTSTAAPTTTSTTSTAAPTITSTTSTVVPTTTIITSTAAPTTTSTASTTAPTTTLTTSTATSASTVAVLTTAVPDIRSGHFSMTDSGRTFSNPLLDVIEVLTVPTTIACARKCARHVNCLMFATVQMPTGYECKVGILTASTTALSGSTLYTKQ